MTVGEPTLTTDALGRLVWTAADGTRHAGVVPVRAFPVTAPDEGVSVVDGDGTEVAWIPDVRELPAELRAALADALGARYFMPVITRITRIIGATEPTVWEVETDHGPTRFSLSSEDDVKLLSDGQAMVFDGNGVRYLIPDPQALDRASRRQLERYL